MKTSIAFSVLFLSVANARPSHFRILDASRSFSRIAKNLPSTYLSPATLGRHLQAGSCGQNCCTPCAQGLEPTRLDTTIDFGDFGDDETMGAMTCEQGAAVAGAFPADDESCPGMQLVGYAFCGCPSPPTMEGMEDACTLCYDGSPVPDPEMMVDTGDGEPISCGVAQVGMMFLDGIMSGVDDAELFTMEEGEGTTDPNAGDFDMCSIIQGTVGTMCGCPVDPNAKAGCNICPPGTVLANPNKAIESEGSEGMTCSIGAQQASFLPSDDSLCAIIQAEAVNAGCKCESPPASESETIGAGPAPTSTGDASGSTGTDTLDTSASGVVNASAIPAIAVLTVVATIMM